MRIQLLYMLFYLSIIGYAQNKGTKIQILSANELVYDSDIGKYQRCIGNVKFKQGKVYMDCDSAWFYEDKNRIEAFGNIYIRQQDSFDLWGNYLEYDGDERIARVEDNVRLTDNDMILRTERLDYDLNEKSAYYVTGGDIINGDDHLTSMVGTYYSRSKVFHFQEYVKLTNPEYEMTSDTLHYNTNNKTAYFFGPTYIYSEENTIFCNYGWYNTALNTSQFSKGASIEGESNKLYADSMVYNRNTGYGEAFRNILLIDTIEEIKIYGEYGNYYRFKKRTMITGSPLAYKTIDDDEMLLKADTMIDFSDTSEQRVLLAYHNVKAFKSDLQSVSDSMLYNFSDSTISFFNDPVVWTDSSQITGDTIIVFRNSEGIDRVRSYYNGFLIEKDQNGLFNQVKGKTIIAHFESGALHHINVDGNGQSVYYALEDSTNYSGVNDIVCGKMIIYMDSTRKVSSITFLKTPKATFYPLEKFPSSKSKLPGYEWRSGLRPKKKQLERK